LICTIFAVVVVVFKLSITQADTFSYAATYSAAYSASFTDTNRCNNQCYNNSNGKHNHNNNNNNDSNKQNSKLDNIVYSRAVGNRRSTAIGVVSDERCAYYRL
jgi:hypothetical protein